MLTLFLHSAQKRRVAVASVIAVTALALSACTGGEAVESERDAAPAVEFAVSELASTPPFVVTGVGPAVEKPIILAIPEGSNTFRIEFDCDGPGVFTVQFGDMREATAGLHRGECGGTSDFIWPITETFRSTLTVFVHDESSWSVRSAFSPMVFVADEHIGADCAAFVPIVSAFENADHGYRYYNAIDEAEWRERVAEATAQLDKLIATSGSELTDTFADVRRTLGTEAGAALESSADSVTSVHTVCNRNHTAVYYMAEFGG